jgi:hypothetical protein
MMSPPRFTRSDKLMNLRHVPKCPSIPGWFLIAGLLVSLAAEAQPPMPYAATPEEIAAMPEACQVKLSEEGRRNQALQDRWANQLGRVTWLHFHHFCHGLKFLNRANGTIDRQAKRYYLGNAVGEFNYVIERWPADSPVRPEAETRKQMAEMLLKLQR